MNQTNIISLQLLLQQLLYFEVFDLLIKLVVNVLKVLVCPLSSFIGLHDMVLLHRRQHLHQQVLHRVRTRGVQLGVLGTTLLHPGDLLERHDIVFFLLAHRVVHDGAVKKVTLEELIGVLLINKSVVYLALILASLVLNATLGTHLDVEHVIAVCHVPYLIVEDGFLQVLPQVLTRPLIELTIQSIRTQNPMTQLLRIAVVVAHLISFGILSHDDGLRLEQLVMPRGYPELVLANVGHCQDFFYGRTLGRVTVQDLDNDFLQFLVDLVDEFWHVRFVLDSLL